MHNIKKAFAAAALLVSAAATGLSAQVGNQPVRQTDQETPTRQGTRGANFLQIGVDARGVAMAGSVVSWAEGPAALYWNASGVANTEVFSFEATRQNLYADLDISHNFFGVAVPAFGGVFGAHVIQLSSGEMERTTPANPAGGDPTFGPTFSWSSMAVGATYARRLTDRLAVGGTVKFISEGITDARTSWGGIDIGTQFNTGIYGVTLGAAVQNVGPNSAARGSALSRNIDTDDFANQRTEIEFASEQTELPTMFRFSAGLDLMGTASSLINASADNRLHGELNWSDAIDTDLQFAGGLEYAFRNMLFLRAGKRFYNDDRATGTQGLYGLSGGFGVRLPLRDRGIKFDYAYTSLGELSNVQVFTLGFGR